MSTNIEIERRWLVALATVPPAILQGPHDRLTQGYLTKPGAWPVVRIRKLAPSDSSAVRTVQTIKQRNPDGDGVLELEFDIPTGVGEAALSLCAASLTKKRFTVPLPSNHVLELDVFESTVLPGLAIAEIELTRLQEQVALPNWLGPEVTGIDALSNLMLAWEPEAARAALPPSWVRPT